MNTNHRYKMHKCCMVLGILILVAGCGNEKRYAYRHIMDTHAKVICDMETRKAAGEKCAIDDPVSLSDAIRIALVNNPDTRTAAFRIRESSAGIEQAKAPFYPFLGFYTEYMKGDAPSGYLFKKIDQRKLPPMTDFNDPGSIENFESGFRAGINLFNGGKDLLGLEMARIEQEITVNDRLGVENQLVATVIEAWYNIMAAREFVKIAKESATTVEDELRVMKVRFRAGGALKSDLLSLEVRLSRAREDIVLSENSLRMAENALASALGINPDTPLILAESDMTLPKLPETYKEGVDYGLDRRPEIRNIRSRIRQAAMAVDRAESGYLPRVNLQAAYYLDDEKMAYDMDRDNWTAAIVLDWDIFSGFATRAEVRKQRARLDTLLAGSRKMELSLKTDIKNAYLNLEASETRLKVAESSVEMAEESLLLVKKQYEGGSATITRYLAAELDRNRARIRSASAFFDLRKAMADVGRAIGYWTEKREEK